VIDVRPADDLIVVGPREALLRRVVWTGPLHWVDVEPADGVTRAPWRVEVRIRHAAPPVPATLDVAADGTGRVTFDAPVFAPAPGQALVAYVGDAVLAGAPIVRSAADAPSNDGPAGG
jgi:tRNA-specific 2-thiouridylase